jgi:FkbM family methyltransferase
VHTASRTYGSLQRLANQGFIPDCILDLGAHCGEWSIGIRNLYPDAFILMLEALVEKGPRLGNVCRVIGNASYLISLIGSDDVASAAFHVAKAVTSGGLSQAGSSKFRQTSSVSIETRLLEQRRVDTILGQDPRQFKFVKLHMQGGELDALRGFGARLHDVEVILTEAAVLPRNEGAPRFSDMIAEAASIGFELADICGEHRNAADGSLARLDLVLVRENSKLRRSPPY